MTIFYKDPDDVLDYSWSFTDWLSGDTISTYTVTVPSGITKDSDSNDDTSVTATLSGGTAGENYLVTCQIVTAGGLTRDESIIVKVREK